MTRSVRFTFLAIGIAMVVSSAASAQPFPSKPLRIAVGFGAGGSNDVAARVFAQKLSELLGQPVLVENRAGVAGTLAVEQVAKAEPDGHRLVLLSSTSVVYSAFKPIPFDMVRDLTPIALVASVPLVLVVNPSVPATSVQALVKLAQSSPGKLTFSSEGNAATSHLAGELFKLRAKVDILHVPFKTGVESANAVAGGQVDISFPSLTAALPLLKADRYRAIAVTSLNRSPVLPSVPTLAELGYKEFNQTAWFGFFGPAGLPRAVIEKLHASIAAVARMPDVRETLALQALEVQASSSEELAATLQKTRSETIQLARDAKLKID